MESENKRRDYQKELRGQVELYLERYPYEHGTRDFPSADELYEELVRPIALASFKNGRETGSRKQKSTSPYTDRGSALENGKLRRKA